MRRSAKHEVGKGLPTYGPSAAARSAAAVAFDVAVAVAFAVNPPSSAPSIAGHGGIGPAGGEAGAEAFSPRQVWRVEKPRHGREAEGEDSRFASTARSEAERPAVMFSRAGGQ